MSEPFEWLWSLEHESDRDTSWFLIPDELVNSLWFESLVALNEWDSLTLEVEKQISWWFTMRLVSRDFTWEAVNNVKLWEYRDWNRIVYSAPLTNGQIDFIEEVLDWMVFKTPWFAVNEVWHKASRVLWINT